ncbi:MAG: hypothetical protein Q7W30_02510 [Coriobacteriia bacterium]|nr:hypothetical protein [Coriobacteriia bacterium]
MVKSMLDYPPDAVEAAKSVMVELVHILGEYRDEMIIVGGWVPFLLMPDASGHVGSTDVDIALNHLAETDEVYANISAILVEHDYVQDKGQPFIWFKDVESQGGVIAVEVDFLAGEYGGTGKRHRTQLVQDMKPRKARGADLLFDESVERQIEARLPSGAIDTVTVRVACVVPYLVMKSSALDSRVKEKDAYDIWFTIANYPGGVSAVAEEFEPLAKHGLVVQALAILESKFASTEHFGPASVALFMEADGEEAERIKRDAYERVQALIAAVRE